MRQSQAARSTPARSAASPILPNIDPERSWRIIEGKLYFVYDPTYAEELDGPARDDWLAKADAHWPELKDRLDKSLLN